MRFQVSQVMDTIEQRLTTDVVWAQAVVDLGEVARHVPLDGGRPVNLIRIGMIVDALSRYLVDGGAMLYGVVGRELLSESALTSKERMVLSRWADDGLIEVTPEVGDRVAEVADLTGLPLIAVRSQPDLARRFPWLTDGSGRVLRVVCRGGVAALNPMDDTTVDVSTPAVSVTGRAKVPTAENLSVTADPPVVREGPTSVTASTPREEAAPAGQGAAATTVASAVPATAPAGEGAAPVVAGEAPSATTDMAGSAPTAVTEVVTEGTVRADEAEVAPVVQPVSEEQPVPGEATDGLGTTAKESEAGKVGSTLPLPVEVFLRYGAAKISRTMIGRSRFTRAEPTGAGLSVLAREWRCDGMECPAFGEYRRIGQPVPRMRQGTPICPRHGEPIVDVGPRPPAYPLSIVVDDLPRQRLVVRAGHPLRLGRHDDDPEVTSVARWLHRGAAAWISPVHVQLEAHDGGVTVTDVSENGTVVWQRKGPQDAGTTRWLRRASYALGEWDSVELYTGIELARGDRRPATALGRDELASVLLDAPTAAHHQI